MLSFRESYQVCVCSDLRTTVHHDSSKPCCVSPSSFLSFLSPAYPSSGLQWSFFPRRGAKTPRLNPAINFMSPAAISTVQLALSGGRGAVAVEEEEEEEEEEEDEEEEEETEEEDEEEESNKSTGTVFPASNTDGSEERSTVTFWAAPGLNSVMTASPAGPIASCFRYANAPPAWEGGGGVGPLVLTKTVNGAVAASRSNFAGTHSLLFQQSPFASAAAEEEEEVVEVEERDEEEVPV